MWCWRPRVIRCRWTLETRTCNLQISLCINLSHFDIVKDEKCDQSDVYSSHVFFSSISPNLPFHSFSLYRSSASYLPLQKSVQSPVNSNYGVRGLYTYIKWIRLCVAEIWPFEVFQNGRHLGFDPTRNGTVWSTVPQNLTLEQNMKGIGWPVAELWPFKIFLMCAWALAPEVGRRSSVVNIHTSYTDFIYSSFTKLGT